MEALSSGTQCLPFLNHRRSGHPGYLTNIERTVGSGSEQTAANDVCFSNYTHQACRGILGLNVGGEGGEASRGGRLRAPIPLQDGLVPQRNLSSLILAHLHTPTQP